MLASRDLRKYTIIFIQKCYLDRDENIDYFSNHSEGNKPRCDINIEQQKDKEFPISKSNAVAKPRTMMIHV